MHCSEAEAFVMPAHKHDFSKFDATGDCYVCRDCDLPQWQFDEDEEFRAELDGRRL